MIQGVPKFMERARALARAAPRRTDAGFLARADKGVGEIFIYDEIGSDLFSAGITAKDIATALDGMKGAREIRLYVNSPGGVITEAVAVVSQLARHPARKVAYVDGIAASAASFIVASADRTVMAKNATIMIHEAWGGAVGSATDLRATADVLDKFSVTIADIYAKRTGKSAAAMRRLMAAETWMTATEAMELGFADEIAKGDPQPARARAEATTLVYARALAARAALPRAPGQDFLAKLFRK